MQPKLYHAEDGRLVNVLGNHILIKVTGEDSGGTTTVLYQRDPPGVGVPMHVHSREDETYYIIQGELEMEVRGEVFIAGPGATVFAPRNVPHAFTIIGDTDAAFLIIVTPGGIENMLEELALLPSDEPPEPPDMLQVSQICERYGLRFLAAAAAG